LRAELANPGIDSDRWTRLCDALALVSERLLKQNSQNAVNLLVSIALPLRDPWDSPAWGFLERAAQRPFNHDAPALMQWAVQAYKLGPDTARPNLQVSDK
jgi:hypothetical protein